MNRKEQIRELWQTCFEDTEAFVDFYFNRVYRDEQALTIERQGRIVSALQMIPYQMSWCGIEISMAYIGGACTVPEERGKGLMGELLNEAFRRMIEDEYDITALIPAEPWLYDYYRKQGYTEIFDYSLPYYRKSEKQPGTHDFQRITTDNAADWFPYFNKKLRERPACVLHSPDDFMNNIMDTDIEGGEVWGIRNSQGNEAGMAFGVPLTEETFIKELLYENEEIKEALLYYYSEKQNDKPLTYKTSPVLPEVHRHGMAKILNPDKMIEQWLSFHSDTSFSAEELKRMDGWTLSRNLFGYNQRESYMSLMLD